MQKNPKLLLTIYIFFLINKIKSQEKKCPNFRKFGSPINLFYTYFRDVFNVLNPKNNNFSIRVIHYSKNKFDDNMKFLFEVKNVHSKRFLKKSFIGFSAIKYKHTFNILKYIESNDIEDIKTILNVEKVTVFEGIFCDELKERFIRRLGRADFCKFVIDDNKDVIHKKFKKLVPINEDQFKEKKDDKKKDDKEKKLKTAKEKKFKKKNSKKNSKTSKVENNMYLTNLMKLKQEIIKQERELQKLNDMNKVQLNELQNINSDKSSHSNLVNKKYNKGYGYNDFFKNNKNIQIQKKGLQSNLITKGGLVNNNLFSKNKAKLTKKKKKKNNSYFSSKYIYRFIK